MASLLQCRRILGVTEDATAVAIKAAYRRMAMLYHPDRNKDPSAEQMFKQINSAYTTLMQTTDANLGDILSDDDIIPKKARCTKKINKPLPLEITLLDAYKGVEFDILGERISLPPGVHSGQQLQLGKYTFEISIENKTKFKRSASDLLTVADISSIDAILGCQLTLVHLDLRVLKYTVPAGLQYGDVVRICGEGMPELSTGKYGDLLVQMHIITPNDLTEQQRTELAKLFSSVTKEQNSNEQKS